VRAPSKAELGRIAGALLTDEGLVEKDWHVVRALSTLAQLSWDGTTRLVFCGGTSLSKGWGLINRFSEDIDFRLWHDGEEVPRSLRRKVREGVLKALGTAGFKELEEKRQVHDDSRFVEMHFDYGGRTVVPAGLRKEIKVEITMERPRLSPVSKGLTSFVAKARNHQGEVPSILCLDPVEIAAEKLSAFTWRALNRRRGEEKDDPSIVRHLHDLAALHERVGRAWSFPALAREVIGADAGRGKVALPSEPGSLISRLITLIEGDTLWKREYDAYIHEVGYGSPDDLMSFEQAFDKLRRYAELFPDRA
jgi:predicted nucleotidyltransferase component of viral defense system